MIRRLAIAAWLGFGLAALFLYPLAVALVSDSYYLQWDRLDIAQTMVVWALLAVMFGFAMFHLSGRTTRGAALALLAVSAIPLASFAAGLARQLPFEDALREAWESRALRLGLPAAIVVLTGVALALWPAGVARWLRRVLIGLSPVSLVVVGSVLGSVSRPPAVVAVERPPAAAVFPDAQGCGPVLAFLFDELSFSYLYDESGAVSPAFPEIRRLASDATHYLSVTAPARDTLISMPSFLAARHLRDVRIENGGIFELTDDGRLTPFSAGEPDGLFAAARRLGFTTEMAGYYLPYCELLGGLVDACRSLSFYNVSSTSDAFSPIDPLLTTLVLWPRQFPFGVLKNVAFGRFQRTLVEETIAFASRPLNPDRPVFRFIHFSIPHLPFVFSRDGYDPPLDPLETSPDTNYVRQLAYVDRLVGELLAPLRASGAYDPATVVLLADHGFRFGGRERDPLHIPFIAKMARQRGRTDVATPARGELLLKDVVERSCTAP